MSFQLLSINSLDSREITNMVEELEMYVNQSYQFTERADLSRNLDSVMEAQFIELNSTWSYENRFSKHFVIFRNFPCLIA